MHQEVTMIMNFLSTLPNRDEIVRRLPFDPIDQHVAFALPPADYLE